MQKDFDNVRKAKASQLDDAATEAKAEKLLKSAESGNTRRALANAVKHFTTVWGGMLPCTSDDIFRYLVTFAGELSVATLEQRKALLGRWHHENGFDYNPCDSDKIRKLMRGIRKEHGSPQKQAKALEIEVLHRVVASIDENLIMLRALSLDDGKDSRKTRAHLLSSLRDKAMLLVSFWFGLRSAEVVALKVSDVVFHWDSPSPYFELTLRSSKTDRAGKGMTRRMERLASLCPMEALYDWVEASFKGVQQADGRDGDLPLFAKVTQWGEVTEKPFHMNSINKLLQRLFEGANLNSELYSSHSMRRGVANWITDSGGSVKELMDWVGWKDVKTPIRYQDGKVALPNKLIDSERRPRRIPTDPMIIHKP